MPRPRTRIILPYLTTTTTTTTTTTKSSTLPIQPSLLTHHTTPPSPLHPLSPLRPLKSPAFFHPTSAHDYNHPLSPLPSPCRHPVPPPQSPLAWTWRCHLCRTTYRLGITRRCLEDGHYFCSNPAPPSPSPSPLPPPSASPHPRASSAPASPPSLETVPPLRLSERGAYHAAEAGAEKVGKRKRGARSKGRRSVPERCTSAFDYLGWADWNAWRREMGPSVGGSGPGLMGSSQGELGSGNKEGFVGKYQKDCFLDCDFPSECSWQRTSAYLESVMEAESPVVPF